jgi:hypothetical protein
MLPSSLVRMSAYVMIVFLDLTNSADAGSCDVGEYFWQKNEFALEEEEWKVAKAILEQVRTHLDQLYHGGSNGAIRFKIG